MKRSTIFIVLFVSALTIDSSLASPNYGINPTIHVENKTQSQEPNTASTKDRLERLGYSTGYGTINGYPGGTGLSAYNPIKLDLGGVVLGTLVGIGAIILIPKILQTFHGGYGSYGRSADQNELPSLSTLLNRIDHLLGQNNIDSTSCVQRTVCDYVRSTEISIKLGAADQMDEFVNMMTENSLVDYLLDGTAIKEALERGKNVNDKPCKDIYTSCPLDSQSAANILMKILPKGSLQNTTQQMKHNMSEHF